MNTNKILLPKDSSAIDTPWLWLGTWSMGGEGFGGHDERESMKVLSAAVKNNIRHFDTAGFYAHGKSEALLEKIIKTDRQEYFISSKGGLAWNGRKVEHCASPEELKKQLHESLKRLKTDYLDLYQLHWPDPAIPLSESINALKEFQRLGLIRFWGVGNLTEKQIEEDLAYESNIPHQIHFNPVHRSDNLLLTGKECCINCIISPLEQGLLGRGKSSSGKSGIGKNDVRIRNPYFSDRAVLKWNTRLNELIALHTLSKATVVLMWICSRPYVHAIIPGPRRLEQLNELLAFKAIVKDRDLLDVSQDHSILSEGKVRKIIPEDIWQHLNNSPRTPL